MNDNLLLRLRELTTTALSKTESQYDSHGAQLSAIQETLTRIKLAVELELLGAKKS
jgi:hypothetical protein